MTSLSRRSVLGGLLSLSVTAPAIVRTPGLDLDFWVGGRDDPPHNGLFVADGG